MKLVDILARELKVWPKAVGDFCCCAMAEGQLAGFFGYRAPEATLSGWSDIGVVEHWFTEEPEDRRTTFVTREQWQAAVDVLKLLAWNGEGLPPAGTVCEFSRKGCGNWGRVEILYVGKQRIFFRDRDGDELSRSHGESEFRPIRPIRTAEQIAEDEREAGIKEMAEFLGSIACDDWIAARELYDAGYRKQATK